MAWADEEVVEALGDTGGAGEGGEEEIRGFWYGIDES